MNIVVLDYGAGNLTSVLKAFRAIGAPASVTEDASALARADAIVVPGVGHFGRTRAITADHRAAICETIARGVPLLGICLGLQWLFEGSEEAADVEGLGVFRGRCFDLKTQVGRRFSVGERAGADHLRQGYGGPPKLYAKAEAPAHKGHLKVPHVGWNTLTRTSRVSRLLNGVASESFAYFTHSFAAPQVDETTATTMHGGQFSSVLENDRVFGVQFHPEKSGPAGLRILSNFLAVAGGR